MVRAVLLWRPIVRRLWGRLQCEGSLQMQAIRGRRKVALTPTFGTTVPSLSERPRTSIRMADCSCPFSIRAAISIRPTGELTMA